MVKIHKSKAAYIDEKFPREGKKYFLEHYIVITAVLMECLSGFL
jgi:hypothetical protein